jgi:thiol-disulfide isomerase/thioredoxin
MTEATMDMRATLRTLLVLCMLAVVPAAAGDATRPAPDFMLSSRAGGKLSLAELRGQVVLINFWATWCGPCRKEMPLLEQIHRRYAPLGFQLLGVNVEEDTHLADAFLRDVTVTFPILLDPQNGVSRLYDVAAMPSTVIVDRKGVVRYVHQGYQPGDEGRYQDIVRQLLRERT